MIEIGKYNTLRVVKVVDFGVYLDGEERGEILLPNEYVPKDCFPEDYLKVFVYFDSEDRIIATTEVPNIRVGEFAWMKVVSTSSVGAFLDCWCLSGNSGTEWKRGNPIWYMLMWMNRLTG